MNDVARVMDSIQSLKDELLKLPQAELELNHYYANGTYTREMLIPAGIILTGKIHRDSCINMLTKGKMLVVTNEDEYEIEAPYTFVSGAGVKKAGVALEDSIWITVHPWNGEDELEVLENKLVVSNIKALKEKV